MFQDSYTYQIRVEGHLDASWSDRLGGMNIETNGERSGAAFSTLTGELADQSALTGVLNALVDLHHVLVSVQRLPAENNARNIILSERTKP